MAAISSLQSYPISSPMSSEPVRSDSSSSSSSTSTSSTTDSARSVTLATDFLLNSKTVAEVLRLEGRLKGKRVMIAAQPLNDGYGDHVAARDMIRFFHQVVGLPKECLSLAIGVKPEDEVSQLLNLHTFTLLDNTETAIKSWNPDYLIFTTCENTGFAALHGYNKPCLAIAEAGYPALDIAPNIHSYAQCLGKETLGMFMNLEMRCFARSPGANDPLQRLAYLKQLPEAWQKEILGSLASNETIEAFNKQNKLHFGYANSLHGSYLLPAAEAMINAHHSSGYAGNHTFCFIGNKLLSPFHEGLKEACRKTNVAFLEYVRLDAPENNQKLSLATQGRTVKFITGTLPEQYVTALRIAAEFEQVATGDSSFASTFPNLPLYQIRGHKERLWKQYLQLLPEPIQKLYAFNQNNGFDVYKLSLFLEKLQRDPVFKTEVRTAMQTIADENDSTPRLVEAMHKLLDAEPTFQKKSYIKIELPANANQLTGKEIPFDQDILLDLEGISSLRLSRDGISGIGCYQDSTFTYKSLQGGYMIRRHRKKS